ncbi:MAG TPA: MarR family transcriptional regulator [Gemmatimonadaceae bacterium]|nr:MarR family transcriptional regulator [Gemmatimonadaceae bacterium]
MPNDDLMGSLVTPQGTSRLRASALQSVRGLVAGMRRSARAIETSVGLSNAQLFLLEQMGSDGPLTVGQLARRLHVRANTVSMTVGKLVERGLARRATPSDDRRRTTVTITAAGRRVLRRAPQPPTTRLLAALDAMPPRDLRALARGLETLTRTMQLDVSRAPLMFEREPGPVANLARRARPAAILLATFGTAIASLA